MQGDFGIKGLAAKLGTLPGAPAPTRTDAAGAPFELEHGVELPTDPAGHRDLLVTLIDQSATLIDGLLGLTGGEAIGNDDRTGLTALKAGDADLRGDVVAMTFTS